MNGNRLKTNPKQDGINKLKLIYYCRLLQEGLGTTDGEPCDFVTDVDGNELTDDHQYDD